MATPVRVFPDPRGTMRSRAIILRVTCCGASRLPLQVGANIARATWVRQEHKISRSVLDAFPTGRDENLDPGPAQRCYPRKIDPPEATRELNVRDDKAYSGCVVTQERKRVLCTRRFSRVRIDMLDGRRCHAAKVGIILNDQDDRHWRARRHRICVAHAEPTHPHAQRFQLGLNLC